MLESLLTFALLFVIIRVAVDENDSLVCRGKEKNDNSNLCMERIMGKRGNGSSYSWIFESIGSADKAMECETS